MEMQPLPDDARRKLDEYRKTVEAAYEAEFKVEDSKLQGAKNATRDQLADLAATAISTLSEIMDCGEKDADRLKASIYVLDKVLGRDTVLDPDDPVREIVERLTAVEE